MKRVVLEALTVGLIGVVCAVIGNAVSPRGLAIGRNYFPQAPDGGAMAQAPLGTAASPEDARSTSGATRLENSTSTESVAVAETTDATHERLRARGFEPIDTPEAVRLFRDPRYEQESIVFIDARNERLYEDGHIPGAYPFDRYYPEEHLPALLPASLGATRVVVYCTGGDCEDSEFAVLTLREAGVPAEVMVVYVGGFSEWKAQRLPIETGPRHSGAISEDAP